jgi:lactoylglutathione lyase
MNMKHLIVLITFTLISSLGNTTFAQTAQKSETATLNHISLFVYDLKMATSFYEKVFNLQKMEDPLKDGKHVWFTLGSAGELHLILGAKKGVYHDPGEHTCFSVSSIEDFMKKLDDLKINYRNWEGTSKTPTLRADGVKQIYFQDPDGYWLEANNQQKS